MTRTMLVATISYFYICCGVRTDENEVLSLEEHGKGETQAEFEERIITRADSLTHSGMRDVKIVVDGAEVKIKRYLTDIDSAADIGAASQNAEVPKAEAASTDVQIPAQVAA